MAKSFLSPQQQEKIIHAIKQAELNTSGEIRLHLEAFCEGDPYERAKIVFEKLGMAKTKLKNGVLFYVAYSDKKFAILGDAGIHALVTDAFWLEVKLILSQHFSKGLFAEGLVEGILLAGEKLKKHFPYQSNDINELSNDISFGEGAHE